MIRNSIYILILSIITTCSSTYAQKSDNKKADQKDTNIESLKNDDADTYVSFRRKSNKFDVIYTTKNDSLIVLVKEVTSIDIEYTYPLNYILNKIAVKDVKQIKYADGRVDLMNEKTKKPHEGGTNTSKKNTSKDKTSKNNKTQDFSNIIIVHSSDSVINMTSLGKVDVKYVGEKLNVTNETLTKNIISIAKKKTANYGGDVLLIMDTKINIAYGELPYIELTGKAYKSSVAP